MTFGIGGEFTIKPVERPIEGDWIRPAEASNGGAIVGAVLKQEMSRVSKRGHQLILVQRQLA